MGTCHRMVRGELNNCKPKQKWNFMVGSISQGNSFGNNRAVRRDWTGMLIGKNGYWGTAISEKLLWVFT